MLEALLDNVPRGTFFILQIYHQPAFLILRLLFILPSIEISIVPRETNTSISGISSKCYLFFSGYES